MAHLTIDERFKIYEMNKTGYSSRYIGETIGRDKSTVCYELKKISGNYRPDKSHQFTLQARLNKKKRKLDIDKILRKKVVDELKRGIAPEYHR
jgi:IS30 family transposase